MPRPRWSALPLRVKGSLVTLLPAIPLFVLWVLIGWALLRDPGTASVAARMRGTEAVLTRVSVAIADRRMATFFPSGGALDPPSPDAIPTDLSALRKVITDSGGIEKIDDLEAAIRNEQSALGTVAAADGRPTPDVRSAEAAAYTQVGAALAGLRQQRQEWQAPLTAASQRRGQWILWLFFLSSFVAVSGGLWAALRLMRGITRRVEIVGRAADQLALGQAVTLPTLGRDEIGRLSARLHELFVQLRDRERELARQNRALAAVNEELEAFSYSVSHDLRAPLRAIAGFSQIVKDEAGRGLGQQATHALNRIRQATERMSALIDALLKLSRVSRVPLRKASVDIARLAGDVVDRLRHAEPSRDVTVTLPEEAIAVGDPDLLQVVLENLIGNAWKFTSQSSAPEIAVSVMKTDDMVTLAVADNGAGFDMAHARMLFVPFQRLHTQREFTGTGIGLATVQRIVRRHGGRISADAAKGKGAVFTVVLPQGGEDTH
jgi:signal transduction histidine kinase